MPNDDTNTWLREQVRSFLDVLPRYQVMEACLSALLTTACRQLCADPIIQTRAKSVASFAEKAVRKRHKYSDPVRQLTDLCGARVLTQTAGEIERVGTFIREHFLVDELNTVDTSQRLGVSEFGYRSVHYIIQVRPGAFPSARIPVEVPESVLGLTAEIQLRTLLEHAWASISHDRLYKAPFNVPARIERRLDAWAATLENVDVGLGDLARQIDSLAACAEPAPGDEQTRERLATLRAALGCAPKDSGLAREAARLALALREPDLAVALLSPFAESSDPGTLRDLGLAFLARGETERHEVEAREADRERGRDLLCRTVQLEPADTAAMLALAESHEALPSEPPHQWIERAYAADPSDPRAASQYLTAQVLRGGSLRPIGDARQTVSSAVERCREQIDVGLNRGRVECHLALLELMRDGEWAESAARAVRESIGRPELVRLSGVVGELCERLPDVPDRFRLAHQILLLGRGLGAPAKEQGKTLPRPSTDLYERLQPPVLIIAGSCETGERGLPETLRELVIQALAGTRGTVISGGTADGVSGLLADAKLSLGDSIFAIGYSPRSHQQAEGYDHIVTTDGDSFGLLEPVQAWFDLLAAGIAPAEVRVLGIGGGPIALFEFQLAVALGARVGLIAGSGGTADEFLRSHEWTGPARARVARLVADLMTVRAFVEVGPHMLTPSQRDAVAWAIHAEYRKRRALDPDEIERALVAFSRLPPDLQRSNRDQAADIGRKLHAIGCTAADGGPFRGDVVSLSPAQIEVLAEMEHGRWNVERSLAGWRHGVRRDPGSRTSPWLVAWRDLPEDAKRYDREAVAAIPDLLAMVGKRVVPAEPAFS